MIIAGARQRQSIINSFSFLEKLRSNRSIYKVRFFTFRTKVLSTFFKSFSPDNTGAKKFLRRENFEANGAGRRGERLDFIGKN
jgi:hypothetical protein